MADMGSQNQTSEILITGGTGLLGKAVCTLFEQKNIPHTVGAHNRARKKNNVVYIDLENGDGMKEALYNKKVVLHLASDKKHPDHDVTGTCLLLNEVKKHGHNCHVIYISIVGTDQLPMTYFKQKMQTEEELVNSGVPYSILRSTQFHDYIDQLFCQFFKLPFFGILPKKVPVQPIDVIQVAEKLTRLSFREPTFNIEEMGGSELMTLNDAAHGWLAVQHKKKFLMNLPLWGTLGNNLKAGALTSKNKVKQGKTWNQWLTEHYG